MGRRELQMLVAKYYAQCSEEKKMSRIGKQPIDLPSGVEAIISGQSIEVKGPKGSRSFTATDDVTIALKEQVILVKPRGSSKRARQQWGMSRTQVANLVIGVTDGFKKELIWVPLFIGKKQICIKVCIDCVYSQISYIYTICRQNCLSLSN